MRRSAFSASLLALAGLLLLASPAATQGPSGYYLGLGYGFTPPTAGDVSCVSGPAAGKIFRLLRVSASGVGASSAAVTLQLRRRALLDTGGTAVAAGNLQAPFAFDPVMPPPSAVVSAWTAAPTINDAGAVLASIIWTVTAQGQGLDTAAVAALQFSDYPLQPTLRSSSQALCINVSGMPAASTISVNWRWTETYN